MTQEIESIGLGMDTSGVERGIKALDVLASKGAPVEKAMAGIEGATERAGKSLKSLGDSAGKGLDDVAKKATPAADGLKKVDASASEAEKSVKSIGKGGSAGLDALGKAAATASTGMRGLGSASTAADKGFRSLATAATEVAAAVRAEAAALTGLQAGFGAVNASNLAAAKSIEEFRRAVAASTAAVESLAAKATALDKLDQAGGKAASGVKGLKSASEGASQSMLALASSGATAFIGSALVRGVAETTKAIYEASAAAQRFQTTLDFASGGRGAQEIAYLRVVTKELGLQFNSTAQAYAGFQAAAKGTALEGQKAREVFESIAKASAVMGLSADQTSGVLLALQQMISKGTVQAEELRGQLGERLPGAFQIAAKAMGVTTAELGKMLERGEVVANDFLPKFAKALEENLGGAAEKAATRLDASVNRVDAAFTRIKQNAGDSGISKFVAGQYEILADGLDGVSTSMERARSQGSGFFGQLAAGSGAVLKFINPLQAFSYSAIEAGNALKQAEEEMKKLQARGAKDSPNFYLRNSYFQLQEYIKELRRAKEEQDKLTGSGPKDPRDQAGFTTRTQSITAENERVAGVRAAVAKIVGTQDGIKDNYQKDLAALYQGFKDNVFSADATKNLEAYRKAVVQLIKDSATAKPDAGANAALNDSLAAQLQAYKNNDKAILDSRKAFYDAQALLVKLGGKSELDAIDESLAKEEEVWAQRKANFEAELAQVAKKKSSQAEVARITGQMQDAERDYEQNIAKLRADSAQADAKAAEALEMRVQGYQKSARAVSEQVRLATLEGQAIGLTGDALREFNLAQVEASATALERKAGTEKGIDLSQRARDALLQEADATRKLAKAQGENRAAQMVYEYAKGIEDSNRLLQAEIGLMGMSEQARTTALEQLRIQLDLEQKIAFVKANVADTDKQAADIAKLQASAAIAKANAANKAFLDEWKTSVGKYDDIFRQGFADMLNNGKDGWKSFTKSLATTFKTTVADTLYKAFAQPFVVRIVGQLLGLTGAMGLSGAANAGQSALSTIGTGASIFNAGSALGGLGAVGGAMSGFATAATASVQSLLGMSGTVAQMTTSLAAAGHTAAAGVSAGVQAFQAIPGWGWAIGAVAALAAIFGKKATPHAGAASTYSEAGGLVSGADIYRASGLADTRTYRTEVEQVTGNVAKAIGDTLNATAKAFGQTAGYEITTAFADDTSKDGAWGSLIIKQMGEAVLDWRDTQTSKWAPREFADGEAGSKEYLAEVAKSARDALVQAIGDVGWANDMLTALGESPTLEGLAVTVQQINAAQAAFDALGKNIVGFGALTDGAISQLVKAAGSIDGLVSAASTYYENFYSEAEKTANVTRDVASALADVGLEMPKTRAEFRALVEAQMALGESGMQAVAALLGVSGAFASITEAATLAQEQEMKAAAADRKDRLAAQRAAEKAQAEALQKQIQAYADGAEQFNVLRDSLLKAGDAAGLLAAVTERAFADPSGKYMNGKYELPRWEEGTTAAAYNYRYGVMQARMRQQLGDEASANALRIQNVKGVLQSYSVEQMMSEYDPVTGPIKLAIQQAIVDASGDLGYAVRDAVQGAALYAAMSDVRGQFTSSGPGLASIAAARATAADASRTSIDPATGLYRIGGAAVEYGKALDDLQSRMRSGAIDAGTFERAVEALGIALPGAAESIGTLEDAISAAQGAAYAVGTAGLTSIRYYFGSLSELTAEFAKAAGEAQEPIAQTTAAIGRLNSAQYAFAESASATLQGFGGGGVGGAWMLQDAGVMKDVTRAQLIAEAAGIASAAMTTADAAAAAAKLAQSPAFAELTAQGIRDAALLLDGVGQYNAEGFERAFIRISDALAKGNVTEAQYKALFDTALDMFNGVPEETRALIDSMTRLRDAMSGFADGLLIDEQRTTLSAGATLAEMQRQYAQAFAGASTGDNEAIGKYQQLATTLLDKELYGSQAEYNAAFGRVYGDARQLEAIGINTLAHAQGNEMVSELKDMNAKLNKRVEDLEKNLMAALAQIAKNTSDTSRGIEQQLVMAEDAP